MKKALKAIQVGGIILFGWAMCIITFAICGFMFGMLDISGVFEKWHPIKDIPFTPEEILAANLDGVWVLSEDQNTYFCRPKKELETCDWSLEDNIPSADTQIPEIGDFLYVAPVSDSDLDGFKYRDRVVQGITIRQNWVLVSKYGKYVILDDGSIFYWELINGEGDGYTVLILTLTGATVSFWGYPVILLLLGGIYWIRRF